MCAKQKRKSFICFYLISILICMYREHIAFKNPPDSIPIWRYMDIEKFEYLLNKQSLWFSNFKKFHDGFEGRYPFGNWKYFYNVLKKKGNYKIKDPDNIESILVLIYLIMGHFDSSLERHCPIDNRGCINSIISQNVKYDTELTTKLIMELVDLMEAHISTIYFWGGHFINCWRQNECESIDMWKEYSQTGKGICIKSDLNRLKECFAGDKMNEVNIGTVNYINYSTDYLPPENMFDLFTHKDNSHVKEREVRAYILRRREDLFDEGGIRAIPGIPVRICLDTLIEKIYVSPTADKIFFEKVKSITEEHNIRKEVILSEFTQLNKE